MFVVVVVWFCCSSWLPFLILTYYSILMHQCLLHWIICFGGCLIVHTEFFGKDLGFFGIRKKHFWVFLSVPHLVDNYAKIVDGRGRNFMCHRTLPSRLVLFNNQRAFHAFKTHLLPVASDIDKISNNKDKFTPNSTIFMYLSVSSFVLWGSISVKD